MSEKNVEFIDRPKLDEKKEAGDAQIRFRKYLRSQNKENGLFDYETNTLKEDMRVGVGETRFFTTPETDAQRKLVDLVENLSGEENQLTGEEDQEGEIILRPFYDKNEVIRIVNEMIARTSIDETDVPGKGLPPSIIMATRDVIREMRESQEEK